jgi:hypothetical protein
MGVILMRPLTSGVFQRLMAEAFPDIDVLEVHLAGGNDRPKLGVFSRGARRIRTSDPAVMSSNPISAAESAKSTTARLGVQANVCTATTDNTKEAPFRTPLQVAGTGFEPVTSGL